MKSKNILFLFGIPAVIMLLYYTFAGDGAREYSKKILKERAEKDQYMKHSSESPFAADPESYHGLNYYPPDERYRVMARLMMVDEPKVRVLSTSDGLEKSYREYAIAEFDLDSRKNRLLILEVIDPGPYRGTLFLAFGDQTSAGETYGAGRYLDVKKVPGSQTIELDFNMAYNPYCAYSDKYSCPFPPTENLLDVAIAAGEKNYERQ